MKKFSFRMTSLALALAMAFGLAACGGGASSTPAASGDASTAESTAESTGSEATGDAITITMMHYSTEAEEDGGNGGAISFRHVIQEWADAHPNVTLEQNVLDNDSYKDKIAALAAADDLPDVYIMQGMHTQQWAADGLASDMSEAITASGNDYNQDLFAPFTTDDGAIYGIPILNVGTCTVVLYDSQLWADAGYETFPDNWDDIRKANEYFEAQGIDTIAFGNGGQWQINSCWLSAVGDRYTGGDWFWDIIANDGTASFTDQAFVDSLAFTQEIFSEEEGIFNADFNAVNNEVARDYFKDGMSAAFIGGNWDVAYLSDALDPELKERVKYAVIPQPDGATATTNTHASGIGYGITVNPKLEGEKRELAMDLATYVTGPAFSNYLAENFALVGACAAADPDLSAFDSFTIGHYEYYNNPSCEIYDSYMPGSLVSVMNTGLQEMLNGTKDADTVAAECQAELESLREG